MNSNSLLTGILILGLALMPTQINAQRKSKEAAPKTTTTVAPADTAKKEKPKGPLSLEKFITKETTSMTGLTTVYRQGDKFFINVNDSLIGRDILMVSRVIRNAEGVRGSFSGYAGDQLQEGTFRFEKGQGDKIFLRKVLYRERSADSTNSMFSSVSKSNIPAIVGSFEVKAQSADKKENVIEVTEFFNADNGLFYFDKSSKKAFKLGNQEKDKSYITDIKTYPINTEVKVVKTYARGDDDGTATFELNVSFVLLPKVPMVPRYYDSRVGYFTTNYIDFDKNPQGVERVKLITRWRVEPKAEDIEKYKRGELVEPAKPIVFYIDPTTPKEWVPYLIQGVNDWEPVFRKAGFKNAIYALVAPTPEEDPTWSLEDATHSAIVYKPSDIANASGPHVHDPRSGEIIESHINWYHNVMSLLRNWYFIQCSPVDPAARKMIFDTELMGQLIRFVSSHEVGHTLGLRHNFAGTAFYTVEQLRDPKFLKENGHTTSIMDYSRFNFVAQPGDNIPRELLFPRLGHYDEWAIEWGYRRFPEIDDAQKELPKINSWIIEKTKDTRYYFGTEGSPNDPRYQAEDLADNQMKSCELGIKNLKFIMDSLMLWTTESGKDYENLRTLHNEVISQYMRYIGHVSKWIGGIYETSKTADMPGAVYTPVEKAKQDEAMAFLKKNVLTTPTWIVPNSVMDKIVSRPDLTIDRINKKVFETLLTKRVFLNLFQDELLNGKKAYTITNLFTDLNSAVWKSSLTSGNSGDAYSRLQQKAYVKALCDFYSGENLAGMMRMASGGANDNSDIISSLFYQLSDLQKKLKASPAADVTSKGHFSYLADMISRTLEDGPNKKKE